MQNYISGVNEAPHFKEPGATSRARWLAKAIYVLKIWMLRKEFPLTATEEDSLKRISIFVVSVYIFAWYQAPFAIRAPKNNLDFLQEFYKFKSVDETLAEMAIKKFTGHLWHLSEETICFALFDERVPLEMKTKIVQKFKSGIEPRMKRPKLSSNREIRAILSNDVGIQDLTLDFFVTEKSIRFFEILQFRDIEFLDKEAAQWVDDEGYIECKQVCENLSVVNDVAERGVGLITEYNLLFTKDETQKQALMIGVAENRKEVPDTRKKTVLNSLLKHS